MAADAISVVLLLIVLVAAVRYLLRAMIHAKRVDYDIALGRVRALIVDEVRHEELPMTPRVHLLGAFAHAAWHDPEGTPDLAGGTVRRARRRGKHIDPEDIAPTGELTDAQIKRVEHLEMIVGGLLLAISDHATVWRWLRSRVTRRTTSAELVQRAIVDAIRDTSDAPIALETMAHAPINEPTTASEDALREVQRKVFERAAERRLDDDMRPLAGAH